MNSPYPKRICANTRCGNEFDLTRHDRVYCCLKCKTKHWEEQNSEHCRARNKRWRERNREHRRVAFKRWYEQNSEAQRAQSKRYRERNPERLRAYRQTTAYYVSNSMCNFSRRHPTWSKERCRRIAELSCELNQARKLWKLIANLEKTNGSQNVV